MTWEIVVGIIALVGAVISIGTIIANNTRAMTEVKCSIDGINETIKAQSKDIHEIAETVNEHETRISVLEHK